MVEVLIAALLAVLIGAATFQFYAKQHELYMAQVDISDRQGNLRFSMDELARQVRLAGYRATGSKLLRTSATFDTLEVYVGNDTTLTIDTLRYYINRFDSPPTLVRQKNKTTPSVFAQGIDTVRFVPVGTPPQRLAVALVTVQQEQFENSALTTRRRLGETINLRNR
jgi:Tfp pilus assembly protein PilW